MQLSSVTVETEPVVVLVQVQAVVLPQLGQTAALPLAQVQLPLGQGNGVVIVFVAKVAATAIEPTGGCT
jgi:hypothetical protein